MNLEILYLPFAEEGPAREMRRKIDLEEYVPLGHEIHELWEKVGEEEVFVKVGEEGERTKTDEEARREALAAIWARWNAGSGGESAAFARRECEDCNASFTGERPNGAIDFKLRQQRASWHENDLGHTVDHGQRSMSVGDIVVVESIAYVCHPIGWEEVGVFTNRENAEAPVEES